MERQKVDAALSEGDMITLGLETRVCLGGASSPRGTATWKPKHSLSSLTESLCS